MCLDIQFAIKIYFFKKSDYSFLKRRNFLSTKQFSQSVLFFLFSLLCSGIRIFGGDVKSIDATESKALVHKLESIDIYSNSWGPKDTAWHVVGPGPLTSEALKLGVKKV